MRSSSVPSRSIKKEEPEEEEWEQLPPKLHEETRPWWVEHWELQATLSRHPDDPKDDTLGQTLAVAHSLAATKPGDLSSDDDEDVKPLVKKGRGGGSRSSGRYGGGHIGY
jgi:hypothetical protein